MTCTHPHCPHPAAWLHDGAAVCRRHAIDGLIRTGRPAKLLASPVVPEEAPGPMTVWDELQAQWESMSIDDHDAVAELVACMLEEGKRQAMAIEKEGGR